MTAVVLALASAAFFGAMTVAVRLGILRAPDARLGAAVTTLVALGVALVAVPFGSGDLDPSSPSRWVSSCSTNRSSSRSWSAPR